MCNTFRSLSVALALVVGSTAVQAERPSVRVASIAVSYRDLDLRKESDARILLARLERAAIPACGGNPQWHFAYQSMPKRTRAVFTECRHQAVARAVATIDAPLLSHAFQRSAPPPFG